MSVCVQAAFVAPATGAEAFLGLLALAQFFLTVLQSSFFK